MESSDLYALVYVSQATRPMSEDDLERLLGGARAFNGKAQITGFLAYESAEPGTVAGTFVQYLEGARDAIRGVFHKRIWTADEHDQIEVKRAGPVDQRSFPEWTMAFERTRSGALDGFSDLIHKLGPPPAER